MLGTLTSALHTLSAAVLDITSIPETLSETDITFVTVCISLAGGGVCGTHGPVDSGNLNMGTARMFSALCPLSSPVGVHGGSCGMLGDFAAVGKGLPIPEIDFLTLLPFLIFYLLANFEVVNSL